MVALACEYWMCFIPEEAVELPETRGKIIKMVYFPTEWYNHDAAKANGFCVNSVARGDMSASLSPMAGE